MVIHFAEFDRPHDGIRHEDFSAFPDKTSGKPHQLPDAGEGGGSPSLDLGAGASPGGALFPVMARPLGEGRQASTHRRRRGAPRREVQSIESTKSMLRTPGV